MNLEDTTKEIIHSIGSKTRECTTQITCGITKILTYRNHRGHKEEGKFQEIHGTFKLREGPKEDHSHRNK